MERQTTIDTFGEKHQKQAHHRNQNTDRKRQHKVTMPSEAAWSTGNVSEGNENMKGGNGISPE